MDGSTCSFSLGPKQAAVVIQPYSGAALKESSDEKI